MEQQKISVDALEAQIGRNISALHGSLSLLVDQVKAMINETQQLKEKLNARKSVQEPKVLDAG